MERVDLVIIGAGWSGLAVAKTYNQVRGSDFSMVVLESAATIGGSWACERLYPGLKTNSAVGSYEFSDFPIDIDRYSLRNQKHMPGHVIQQYLVDFADHFGFSSKIRLQTEVKSAVMNEDDGTWRIEYSTRCNDGVGWSGRDEGKESVLIANKLVVATGLTSQPQMPSYPGQASFQGHVLHSKELRARARDLEEAKQNVIVVGANKSAWDACYTASHTTDGTVHMLIRPSGRGPTWIWRKLPGK
jgi:cation diffusion facilitator CzcD-associated flavoprotein CzcO